MALLSRAKKTLRMAKSEHVSFRLSAGGKTILATLQQYYGLTQGNVFELLLRNAARELGIPYHGDSKAPKKK